MQRKIISYLFAFLCALSVFSLAGCSTTSKDASVYLLTDDTEWSQVLNEIVEKYREEKNVSVRIETTDDYDQTLRNEIAKTDAPTIFHLGGSVDCDAWKDSCMDLKDSELYSHLIDKSLAITDEDGDVCAIPYSVEAYGILCNDEILRKYFALPTKKSTLDSVREITGFDELKTVVEDITAHKEELGIDGVFASVPFTSSENARWYTHLLNVPLYYEFRENEDYSDAALAGYNSKEIAFRFSDNFHRLLDLYLENSATPKTQLRSKSDSDAITEFALGKAAMMQTGTWTWSKIAGTEGNTVMAENMKLLPLYTGIEGEKGQGLCIGSENYFAVNKSASKKQQEAALEFLDWLFSSETGKKIVSERLQIVTPFSTFTEDELPDQNPLAKEMLQYMKDSSVTSVPWIFTTFSGDDYQKLVGEGLLAYLQGDKEWNDVAADIRDAWKRITR